MGDEIIQRPFLETRFLLNHLQQGIAYPRDLIGRRYLVDLDVAVAVVGGDVIVRQQIAARKRPRGR
jgi:hypothetical protein